MYTAYPDPEPEAVITTSVNFPAETVRSENLAKLYKKIQDFVKNHSAEDFAGCSPAGEPTRYKTNSKAKKVKGGKPPRDYFLTEEFIDLTLLVSQGNFEEALPIYFQLSRFA